MPYRAEYIWIDGQTPTAKLRSKTKIVPDGQEPPIWGFDGSSTEQAPGDQSDCVLRPVLTVPDPIRGGDDVLVLNEVLNVDMTPHESNTRAQAVAYTREGNVAVLRISGFNQNTTSTLREKIAQAKEEIFSGPAGYVIDLQATAARHWRTISSMVAVGASV